MLLWQNYNNVTQYTSSLILVLFNIIRFRVLAKRLTTYVPKKSQNNERKKKSTEQRLTNKERRKKKMPVDNSMYVRAHCVIYWSNL